MSAGSLVQETRGTRASRRSPQDYLVRRLGGCCLYTTIPRGMHVNVPKSWDARERTGVEQIAARHGMELARDGMTVTMGSED